MRPRIHYNKLEAAGWYLPTALLISFLERNIMGKYQLDYKGMQQVERYHEKNATVKNDKKARVQALLKKAGKKK